MADQKQENGSFWFPAKRYGWGWGFPVAWQGWVVFISYLLLVIVGAYKMVPGEELAFTLLLIGLTAGLIAICWIKGEPPQWRWGKKNG